MSTLKSRLLCVETDFISALVEGNDALSAFDQRWEQLLDELNNALSTDTLDMETSSLAHATASRMATLADISAEVIDNYNILTSQLIGQLDTMMSDLSLSDISVPIGRVSPAPSVNDSVSRKRRRSHELSSDSSTSPCTKRARIAPHCASPPSTLRTPRSESPAGCSQIPIPCESQPHQSLPSVSASSLSPCLKRKRRASMTDTLKNPITSGPFQVGPRLHAVSDSFLPVRSSECYQSAEPDLSPSKRLLEVRPKVALPSSSTFDIQPMILSNALNDHTDFDSRLSTLSELPDIDEFLSSFMDSNLSQNPLPSIQSDCHKPSVAYPAISAANQGAYSLSDATSSCASSPPFPPTPILASPRSPTLIDPLPGVDLLYNPKDTSDAYASHNIEPRHASSDHVLDFLSSLFATTDETCVHWFSPRDPGDMSSTYPALLSTVA
ncbi:hypothetical protein C8Q80DRAFT_1130723 [Daedaleopsis nitida]|nr:hypothetical protein C8Q80DRAFT_1130723 [Daedaleopsis nitida]